MKKLMTTLVLAGAVLVAQAQSKAVQDFQNKYENDRDAKVVSLNGSLFQLVSNITKLAEDDKDAEVMSRIAGGINAMKILAVPLFKTGLELKEIEDLRSKLKSEKYEELMTVRDGRERVYFMAKSGENKINNMLVLINDDKDEFVLINIDGELDMKDLAYLAEHHKDWH